MLDYGADRDIHYLVMEYIEGKDLRETLEEKGPLPWKEALEIIDQLATALEHAHLYGIVHRDIKPQNMMLTESGLLKVLDFGIARVPTLPSLTQSGFVGSPYYVSPEQAMGEEIDTRSDIYSSGIVLYELLSGRIPFDAKSPWSIINQHITTDPPPLRLPQGEIPEGVHQLLNRMVAKRSEDRFPTPDALRRAIAAVLAGDPIPDSTLDTQPITPPDREAMAEGLYQRALKSIESEEWGRAVDLLNQVLNLMTTHAEAQKKLAQAEHQAFLASLYNAGKRALDSGRWEEAINSFNGVLELETGYKEAPTLLAKAKQALEEENLAQYMASRYNEGLAHLEAERWHHAIDAFAEVQELSPGYEDVEQRLAEANRLAHPSLFQRMVGPVGKDGAVQAWVRWGLIAIGIVAIIALFIFNSNIPVTGNDDIKDRLKGLYTEAQAAIEENHTEQAIALLDQILAEDPDYADAADLRRDLVISLTPTPTLTPTPAPTSTPTTATPAEDSLAVELDKAQEAIILGQWSAAIDILDEIRSTDADYEAARIASLYCDGYVGRGLESLATINSTAQEEEIVGTALADFEAGTKECPRRIDLQDQAERAKAYLEAINTPKNDFDKLVQLLTPIVAADPDYSGGNAKKRLYTAYLERGNSRYEESDIVGALSDYEAALALNVDDPSKAQTRRAELLLSLSQPASQPVVTPSAEVSEEAPATAEPTQEPVRIRFGPPQLVAPEDDSIFAGKFVDVTLEWEPVGQLANDEYYDVTVMHIFADEPHYWGTATKETQIQLNPDIGVGKAGGDRFYWWVTVRKENSAPSINNLDLPVSQQSEAKTFIWSP